jgi:beta-carotene/zeaxanthin 4-ketolase
MYSIPNHERTALILAVTLMIVTPISVVLSIYTYGGVNIILTCLWVCLNCWLFTGLFITAHDCMHNSVSPTNFSVNRRIGTISLLIYAGLSYDKLLDGHILHHRHVATEQDPDYLIHRSENESLLSVRWYISFLRSYLTWHPFAWMAFWFTLLDRGIGVSVPAMLMCWIAPQVLSTLQLFYFGTYKPHKGAFESDSTPSRSNEYPYWLSLLTCFHFGYHREHHNHPYVPWWYLPSIRSSSEGHQS